MRTLELPQARAAAMRRTVTLGEKEARRGFPPLRPGKFSSASFRAGRCGYEEWVPKELFFTERSIHETVV